MQAAIEEARKAESGGEVPIGAVAVVNHEIIARAYNIREATGNPLGHAEILLLQKVAATFCDESAECSRYLLSRGWRLTDVTVVVTCEPCLMCMGALLQARIPKLVYGCKDPKAGACGSLYDLSNDRRLNHRIKVVSGVLVKECGDLLSQFFGRLRDSIA